MHVHRAAVATALAGAALCLSGAGLSAPLAAADPGRAGPSNIVVSPKTVEQGGTLTITVDGHACRGIGRPYDAIVESNAFPRTRLKGLPDQGSSAARPKVFTAVQPGTHTVSATCGGRTVTSGHFRVVPRHAAGDAAGDTARAGREPASRTSAGPAVPQPGLGTAPRPPVRSAPAIPHHPVRGGVGGGSVHLNPVTTAMGIGLVAGSAVACGYFLIRRPRDVG